MDSEVTLTKQPKPKVTYLMIKMTPEFRARVNEAARLEGLATGPWFRSLGAARARHLLDPAPPEYVRERVEGVRKRLKKG